MDEAYKAVKTVENPLVWENMAQVCELVCCSFPVGDGF